MKFNDMKKRVKTFNVKIETFDSIAVSCNNTPKYSEVFYAANRNILMKELRQTLRKRNICKPDLSKITLVVDFKQNKSLMKLLKS